MTTPDLPPHVLASDGVDEEAEAVVSALARLWGAPPWRITDDRTAEWVMAKLRAAAASIEASEAQAAEWRQRIDDWLADNTRRARATSAWAEAHLTRWLADLHAADEKVKSRKLPSGKVTSTEGRLEWVVEDEDAAVRALADEEDLDHLVKTSLAGVRDLGAALTVDEAAGRAVTPGGTVVPGITIRRKPRTYKASPT